MNYLRSEVVQLRRELMEIIQMDEALKAQREFAKGLEVYSQWISRAVEAQDFKEVAREDLAVAFNNRGQLKYLKVDFDGAVEDYSKALEFCPKLASAYYNRGTIFYRMGYFQKALGDLEKANDLAPHCPEFSVALEKCRMEIS